MPVEGRIERRAAERKGSGSRRSRRAQKTEGATKASRIDLRVSPKERDGLKANAEALGLSLSAYVLDATIYSSAAEGREPSILSIDPEAARTRAELIALERDLYVAVTRIGANVNQIARALNVIAYSGDDERPADEPERIRGAIDDVERLAGECEGCVEALRRAVSQAHRRGASH